MTRGTTPTYIITVKDFDTLQNNSVRVTFKQNDTCLTLKGENITTEGNKVSVFLTQEQTLRFRHGIAKLQVRGVDINGTAWASNIVNVPVNSVLCGEVLDYE